MRKTLLRLKTKLQTSTTSKRVSLLVAQQPQRFAKTLIALIALTSCTTAPTKSKVETIFSPQAFSSDVFFEEKGKSFKLKSDIYLLSEQAVRVDIRTQLDLPIASILMTDKKLEYVLYRDKKYFSGKPGPGVLDKIIPLDISAEDLVAVVREKKLKNQKCEVEDGKLASCRGQSGPTAYHVSWGKRVESRPWSGKATRMIIEIPQRKINLKFYYTDLERKLSNLDKLSVLNIPPDFSK